MTIYVHPDIAVPAELAALVDAGGLHVDVAERVRLADLAGVHARSDAGRVHGKVIAVLPVV